MTVSVPPATAREEVDPRCFAPVGIAARTPALLTPVAQRGGLLVEHRAGRRGTPYWSVLLAVVGGPAAGLHAELRVWHASRNRAYVAGRLGSLLGIDPAEMADVDPDVEALRPDVERALAVSSYRGSVGTATDGRLEAAWIDAAVPRAEPGPGLPPAPAVARVAPPPEPFAAEPALDALAFIHATTPAEVRRAAEALVDAPALGLDIETDCGPLGSPADWKPSDGAIRLVQVAGRVGDRLVCAVVDCYACRPDAVVRLLAAPGRRVVAHNIRYEQEWLAFHLGVPRFADPLDTSCAFRILERHWSLLDPGYQAQDSRLETVMRRVTGQEKSPFGAAWWGAEPLPAPQLRYAALDAACLLPIADAVDDLAGRMGCAGQVAAASRTACDEALRRLPTTRDAVRDGAGALLDSATTRAGLDGAARILATLALGAPERAALREHLRARRVALPA